MFLTADSVDSGLMLAEYVCTCGGKFFELPKVEDLRGPSTNVVHTWAYGAVMSRH